MNLGQLARITGPLQAAGSLGCGQVRGGKHSIGRRQDPKVITSAFLGSWSVFTDERYTLGGRTGRRPGCQGAGEPAPP